MVMMRSEDGSHGTHIPAHKMGELLREEESNRGGEPYAIDDDMLKENDARSRAYMELWSHYECAYNAVNHRRSIDFWVQHFQLVMEAILGREVDMETDDAADLTKLVARASAERARLLASVERSTETLALQAESIASQQRLIEKMSGQAAKGKAAYDAMMQVAIQLGINPVPSDAEELAASIKAAIGAAPTERQIQ